MCPKIIKSHILAKDIFKAKKLESKIKYLNLELITNEKFNNPDPFGVYFMFFKKNLIYIGSWCGNWNKNSRELKDSAANQRWQKHLITDTTRFKNICFFRRDNQSQFDYEQVKNILKDQSQLKKKKVTLTNLINLKEKNKVHLSKYQLIIEERLNIVKNGINNFYSKNLPNNDIFNDIILPLQNISCDDKKEYQLMLTGGDMAHSLNRFKVASLFWNDFKNRDENNIFEDFEFIYFKFDNFINYVPLDCLDNNLLKDKVSKDEVKKNFRKEFEKPLREIFKPIANVESKKPILKKYDIETLSNTIIEKLKELYDRQNFFIK
tara:strand:+ start:481 stop:1443 length:963 start_codon:yes stop_codon:yes gene_type:complete